MIFKFLLRGGAFLSLILSPVLTVVGANSPQTTVLEPTPPAVPARLSVREAARITVQNNPQLKQSRVTYLASKSGLASARDLSTTSLFAGISRAGVGSSGNQTSARTGGQFTWQRRGGDELSATVVPASTSSLNSNLQLQYRRPFVRASGSLGQANVSITSAEYDLVSQDNQLYLARQNAVQETVRSYFQAVRARDLIAVSESDVGIAKETVRIASRKLEEGLIAEIEVSRAKIQLAQSEDNLIQRKRAQRDALDALLLSMGLKVGQSPELIDTAPSERITVDVNSLLEEALANRKDLLVEEVAIKRQELELRISGNELRPSVDLVADYTKAGLGISGANTYSAQSVWSAGIDYSLPIGSVSRKERRSIAQRNLEQLYVDKEFRRQRIKNEVLAAARTLEAAGASLDIFKNDLSVAEENLKLAQRMVEEGLVSNRDVLEAQVALTRTRSSLLSAQIDYYLALIDLKKAVGRDLAGEMTS